MKNARSLSRGLRFSKIQIEKRRDKLKRRMNNLYLELMDCEKALQLFEPVTKEEKIKETGLGQELHQKIIDKIEKLEENTETK